jgi:sorting nexin-1/2
VEYKVTYWTTLPQYKSRSGCVTRRYSDFEWLWKMLRGSMDGIIVPAPPSKTLMPNDDPKSAAIDKRHANLALFIARVAAHPVMCESADLQIFLEEADKNSWSERVPWYERGVTSDALKGVSDWFHSTVRMDDTGTAAHLLAGAAAGAAAARGAAAAAASRSRIAAAAGTMNANGGSPRGVDRVPMPALISGTLSAPPNVANLSLNVPVAPSANGGQTSSRFDGALVPGSPSAPSDGILETQHFLEVAEYVAKLKGRVEKMLLATSALVKHSAHIGGIFLQFAAVVSDLEEMEDRAARRFRDARVASAAASGSAVGDDETEKKIEWTNAALLFVATSGPPRAQAEAILSAFLEPLESAAALCCACVSACDTRKAIAEHYNRLCRQISRLDAKIATLGVPEPGPKREEKQKVELAASDLRIERTRTMHRYERCVEHIERELLWWHTELATTLGLALKNFVAAQGAAAGRAMDACKGHFDAVKETLGNPPSSFV